MLKFLVTKVKINRYEIHIFCHRSSFPFAIFQQNPLLNCRLKPLASQSELLKSDHLALAQNKKLVYDMWREFLEGGHLELAEKYFAEDYMQHNPLAGTGRKALVDFFSRFSKPKDIADSIKSSGSCHRCRRRPGDVKFCKRNDRSCRQIEKIHHHLVRYV